MGFGSLEMAKFITVNCGLEPILVNTDCSVMHFLLYLTNRHVQLQVGLYGLSSARSIDSPENIARSVKPKKGK